MSEPVPQIGAVLLVWLTEWARLTWHRDQTAQHAAVHAVCLVGLTGLTCYQVWHVWPLLPGSPCLQLTAGGRNLEAANWRS